MFIQFLLPSPKASDPPKDLPRHLAQPLIEAGFAKEVPRPPAKPGVVTWSVSCDELSNVVILHGTCSHQCGSFRFHGDPALLRSPSYAFQHGCLTVPTAVPADVIERYSSMRSVAAGNPVPQEKREGLTLEDAERLASWQAKVTDGARLDAQIKAERLQRQRLGY